MQTLSQLRLRLRTAYQQCQGGRISHAAYAEIERQIARELAVTYYQLAMESTR